MNQTINQVKEKNAGAASKQETKQEAMGSSLEIYIYIIYTNGLKYYMYTVLHTSYREGRYQPSKESSQYAAKQAMKQPFNRANHQAISFSIHAWSTDPP